MIYKVCIQYIFSRLQKTKRPKMTPANNYVTQALMALQLTPLRHRVR